MMRFVSIQTFLYFLLMSVCIMTNRGSYAAHTLNLTMYSPDLDNSYTCTAFDVPDDGSNYYIVGFEPHAIRELHHHLTIDVCPEVGHKSLSGDAAEAWDCGLANRSQRVDSLPHDPVCVGADYPLYAFVADSDKGLYFPPGVGLEIGIRAGLRSIVLGSHYPDVKNLTNGRTGKSAVSVLIRKVPREAQQLKKAGYMTLTAWGIIPPKSLGTVRGTWTNEEDIAMHLIATSIHTHLNSTSVTLSMVNSEAGKETILLQVDPNVDIHYHYIPGNATITHGDQMKLSCDYNNTLDVPLKVLQTEMCIFDVAYFVDGDRLSTIRTAFFVNQNDASQFLPFHGGDKTRRLFIN